MAGERVEDLAGDGAAVGAEDGFDGSSLGRVRVVVGAGCWVVGQSGFDDVVQRGVGLPVTAAGESVTVGAPGGDRDGGGAAECGEGC